MEFGDNFLPISGWIVSPGSVIVNGEFHIVANGSATITLTSINRSNLLGRQFWLESTTDDYNCWNNSTSFVRIDVDYVQGTETVSSMSPIIRVGEKLSSFITFEQPAYVMQKDTDAFRSITITVYSSTDIVLKSLSLKRSLNNFLQTDRFYYGVKVTEQDGLVITRDDDGIRGPSRTVINSDTWETWFDGTRMMWFDTATNTFNFSGRVTWLVNGTNPTNFTLTPGFATLVANSITLTGYVTFNDLAQTGKSTINGNNITTGVLNTNNIQIRQDPNDSTFVKIAGRSIDLFRLFDPITERPLSVGSLGASNRIRLNPTTGLTYEAEYDNAGRPVVEMHMNRGGIYASYTHWLSNDVATRNLVSHTNVFHMQSYDMPEGFIMDRFTLPLESLDWGRITDASKVHAIIVPNVELRFSGPTGGSLNDVRRYTCMIHHISVVNTGPIEQRGIRINLTARREIITGISGVHPNQSPIWGWRNLPFNLWVRGELP